MIVLHGFSVAEGIAKAVSDEREGGRGSLAAVRVRVGRNMFHSLEELLSAWDIVSPEYGLDGVRLEVEVVDGGDCVLDKLLYSTS
ncbi:MAG: hypothetical protein GF416_02285 [Candidatus Altiarchaeales archaeon]|nr:hypothetical protein [Candidatus Altiarchaeales archaeon]MBD3415947.1 hypothetical protein [Candidatus Altiarchaeales archaeon]